MNHSSLLFPIIFILPFSFVLNTTSVLFHFMNDADHDLTSIISFPKIEAKSNTANIRTFSQLLDEVRQDNLEQIVRDLSSFHTRHTESKFLDAAAFWLSEKLQSVCDTEVYVQHFTYTPANTNARDDKDTSKNHRQEPLIYNLKNIACQKPGSTNNTIIISAHYDSRMEDINNSTAKAPGADDNASGVSALLELARILSNKDLSNSIIFVLFSAEEQGKWGSTYYADYINEMDVDLDLLINLDMVGYSSNQTNDLLIEYDYGNVAQDNDKYSHAIARFIKTIAEKYTNLNPTLGLLGNSDYVPFEAFGYTVIGLHDDGVTKNPNHHKSTDSSDLLDYKYLTSVTELTLATILNIDTLTTSANTSSTKF